MRRAGSQPVFAATAAAIRQPVGPSAAAGVAPRPTKLCGGARQLRGQPLARAAHVSLAGSTPCGSQQAGSSQHNTAQHSIAQHSTAVCGCNEARLVLIITIHVVTKAATAGQNCLSTATVPPPAQGWCGRTCCQACGIMQRPAAWQAGAEQLVLPGVWHNAESGKLWYGSHQVVQLRDSFLPLPGPTMWALHGGSAIASVGQAAVRSY